MDHSTNNKECCIYYCDGEDDLVPICEHHYIHKSCLSDYINKHDTDHMSCPLCRNEFLDIINNLIDRYNNILYDIAIIPTHMHNITKAIDKYI